MLLGIVVSGTVVVVCCFVRLVDHNAESAASVDAVVNVAGAIGYGITAISARYLSAEQITFAGGAILLLYFVIRAVLYGITSGTEEALVLYGREAGERRSHSHRRRCWMATAARPVAKPRWNPS